MKRQILISVILFLGLIQTACTQNASLTGVVYDNNKTIIPFAGIEVNSNGTNIAKTTADFNGAYKISGLKAGTYTVKAYCNGYKDEIKNNVSIKEGKETNLDFFLFSKEVIAENILSPIHTGREVLKKSETISVNACAQGYSNISTYDSDVPFYDYNTESYDVVNENIFHAAVNNPLSTFSIDVDRASYANTRRFLNQNTLPPIDAVRIEELINYFDYKYPQPSGDEPFSVTMEMGKCPWNENHNLVMIGLKGKEADPELAPPSNLVFLIDVSGSMYSANKLPLLKQSFKILVSNLRKEDKVAIVVYAGAAGLVLESTPGDKKDKIISVLDKLEAGGSTAGGEGLKLAYKVAKENFIPKGNNRVILATDGDFNVGESSDAAMVRLIEGKRDEGVFLTVLGFGMGNYKDSKMEQLSNAGNGNYAYIDNILEAKKMFGTELYGTLFTIAKDVKIQVEFNPAKVKGYRLIGYENRMLKKEDFNNDKKDAGDIGCGHTVTAFYEIIPAGSSELIPNVDPLKYQEVKVVGSDDLMTVKLRYKKPDEDVSKLIVKTLKEKDLKNKLSEDFMFAASVAEFGMLIRKSEHKGKASWEAVLSRANHNKGTDPHGYKAEFIKLAEIAQALMQ